MQRMTLLAHAPTAATAAAAFPAGEPLDDRGRMWARAGHGRVPRVDRVRCGPERACVETCAEIGVHVGAEVGAAPGAESAPAVELDDGLRGWDLGQWRGRTLDELTATAPEAVAAWSADPAAAPHGGESLVALVARVGRWLGRVPDGRTLAVCAPSVVRAAVVVVLQAPPSAFWRLDVAPLTATDLRGGPGRWTVRATAVPLHRT